jgi:large subunit ribosomal protein L22
MANAVEKIREFRAEAKFQRTSPQKAKLVLDLIKGLRVEQALNTVHFSNKRMAPVIEKVLRSAIQNATYVSQEQGLDVDVDNLYVRTAVANEGPRMKRIRPAPMGRAFRYQRRLAHIIVTVAEKKPVAAINAEADSTPAPAAKKTTKKAEAKPGVKKAAQRRQPSRRLQPKRPRSKPFLVNLKFCITLTGSTGESTE